MPFKFEKLEVWQLSVEYVDQIYDITSKLPSSERFNLSSQIIRAATGVALNIAEGSTGQTDAEQARYLGLAIRSLLETVACLHLIGRRGFLPDGSSLNQAYRQAELLAARLHSMRRVIEPEKRWLREDGEEYAPDRDADPSAIRTPDGS